jgi:uncharacterized repeat protein (TIGR03806 family)
VKRAWLLALVACGGEPADERCTIPGGPGDGPGIDPSGEFCDRLSTYRFFDDLATQTPAPGVVPFEVNTPLFSDYTVKHRFLYLPPGTQMTWDADGAFELPAGAALIKTFGYLRDRRDPALGTQLLETRVMVNTAEGWTGASYVHDHTGNDATLALAGAFLDTSWIHDDGEPRTNRYAVPNKNQCKNCHAEHDEQVDAVGLKARHVNKGDQLQQWIDRGLLANAPAPADWPRAPAAFDAASGTVDERARAWLDINCAHCHNTNGGAARTSGLYLDLAQTDLSAMGVCKPPVAAGGGSGGRAYGIVPGDPDASILVFRLESTEPDVRMPELGRNLVDAEGTALIREWITALPGTCGS